MWGIYMVYYLGEFPSSQQILVAKIINSLRPQNNLKNDLGCSLDMLEPATQMPT